MLGLSFLSSLRHQGLLAQTLPLESAAHKFQPGQQVLVKSWKDAKLQPDWEGAFQVLLITETVVRPAEKGWTHYTWIKEPIRPPKDSEEWQVLTTDDPLQLKIQR